MKIKFTDTKQICKIVEGCIQCPDMTTVTRRQDDTDGSIEMEHEILLSVGPDGDMYIAQFPGKWLRFRTEGGGGGSPRTHNALRILHEAIRLDNLDRSQALKS